MEESVCIAHSLPNQLQNGVTRILTVGKLTSEFQEECPCRCSVHASRLVVNCNNNQLMSIPPRLNASTYELHLFKNQLTSITSNSSLNMLEVLNVSYNQITYINREWLPKLHNLKVLDISRNKLGSQSLDGAFSNLSVYYLNLSFNSIGEISALAFIGLDSLRTLDLSHNEIRKLDHQSFQDQVSLEFLDLSFNYLPNLKHEWFKNLVNLTTLILHNNTLQSISNVVFSPLSSLQNLDLSMNSISAIGFLSFKGLSNLQNLNLSHNLIGNLQEGCFRPLEHVKVIDLSYNPFQKLDRVFTHVGNLRSLHLKYLSNFKSLTSYSLTGLTELQHLDLSGSQSLSDISRSAFSSAKKLKKLDLSNTNLTNLKMGLFNTLADIETVKLSGNPWRCDCYLYWILLWLGENKHTNLLSAHETVCQTPSRLEGSVLLDALDHDMVCTSSSILHVSEKTKFRVGSTAVLQCQVDGNPPPILTWITPQKLTFHWTGVQANYSDPENITLFPSDHPLIHTENWRIPENALDNRFHLMNNGNLLIRNIERGDGGFYKCIASNPLNNQTADIRLTLDYDFLNHVKIASVLVGVATSFSFLLLTLITELILMILKKFGIAVKCPCRSGKNSPKSQQIKKILESIEHYKKQQLDRLRDNYNFQVQRIKENCMQQMERLRESYSSQAERLRDIRDYGTLQIDRIRENYYSQVQRVRDYSTSQIEKLRENYLFQRNRIRKFSTHHLYKLRENYKLQQQHLNKILENLNIESCRNVCQRTESAVFEPDITLENVFVPKICLVKSFPKDGDSVDNSSQISAYFTPDEAVSEVSGHESDEQDVSFVGNSTMTSSISDSQLVLKLNSSIPLDSDFAERNIQPHIVICNSAKTMRSSANETIV